MDAWFIETKVHEAILNAINAGVVPTPDQQQEFKTSHVSLMTANGSRIMNVAGTTAEISVKGVLTKQPDFFAYLFGGGNTTYAELTGAINDAEMNPDVNDIVLRIDSPGGQFEGLFNTLSAIASTNKPINAVVDNMCASAAYAIAAQCDKIEASNNAAMIGSIGVAVDFRTSANVVTLTSTNAPNKRPDVTTEEGKAVVVKQLDEIHNLFVEAISEGRDVTAKTVNTTYGQGAMFLSGEALNRGMIDGVSKPNLKVVDSKPKTQTTAKSGGNNKEVSTMDKATLKASHPETFAAVLSDGKEQGVQIERDRINAHLTMGKVSGAEGMKIALTAIEDGTEYTAAFSAKYTAAGMNNADLDNRDDDNADDMEPATTTTSSEDPEADAVLAVVERNAGVSA